MLKSFFKNIKYYLRNSIQLNKLFYTYKNIYSLKINIINENFNYILARYFITITP